MKLTSMLFPKTCPMCGRAIPEHAEICPDCRERLHYVGEPKCKKCGKPFDSEEEQAIYREYCGDCEKNPHVYDMGMALFYYDETVRESIYRFKYHGQQTYGGFYGMAMAKHYGRQILALGVQAIVPVPISRQKKITRGYNQAELIADSLGMALRLPVLKETLIRTRNTVPQKELDNAGRRNNLKNAFKIQGNIVQYKQVLLVDDIYTTGSTADACALALKAADIKRVYFISVAISEGI